MKSRQTIRWPRLLLGGALLLGAALAQAQYVWLDEKGLRQYSDRPPAPSVPAKRILKMPGGLPPGGDAAPEAAPAAAAPTTAERNADYNKRRAAAAEKEQKAGDAARRQANAEGHCDSLRKSKLQLESGRRIGVTDKSGEAGYMDDGERARQLGDVRRALAECP
ncbi:DUF4124 domain-containing protein [Janthinobacterium sp.]|uniref:DUF4124 domain-containing protein n=1 Tax=Janthinobacterium sp. TaxID=1871054 RepID=UPI00293D35DC|nr:DUF4124 domain-containing protein [Janthinobacterium sp.]